MPVMTTLSGNEMWCLSRKGLYAGNMVVGNSVYSMGLIGSMGSGLNALLGGEVTQITELVHDGRTQAYQRLVAEAERHGGVGLTGVSNELVVLGSNIEFLSMGSTLHANRENNERLAFTSSADGQELYCQIDAGFQPVRFVFGNVAYSVGVGGGVMGALRSFRRGEVVEFSNVFNQTRHLALTRITQEAAQAGANAVVGIKTSILPFQGVQEMVMVGTAARHPSLPPQFNQSPVSSDLTCQEMWNLTRMEYLPLRLVLGVSVYSLGLLGRVTNWLSSWRRGELTDYTKLVYEARENALSRIAADAQAIGADDVAGVKTYVYDLGAGLIEFLAIGTAVKKVPGVRPASEQLPAQAVIQDRDTFVNTVDVPMAASLNSGAKSASGGTKQVQGGLDVIKLLLRLLR